MAEVEDTVAQIESRTRRWSDHPQDRGDAEYERMFHASGLLL